MQQAIPATSEQTPTCACAVVRIGGSVVALLIALKDAVAAGSYRARVGAIIVINGIPIIARLHACPHLAIPADVGFAQKRARAIVGIACT